MEFISNNLETILYGVVALCGVATFVFVLLAKKNGKNYDKEAALIQTIDEAAKSKLSEIQKNRTPTVTMPAQNHLKYIKNPNSIDRDGFRIIKRPESNQKESETKNEDDDSNSIINSDATDSDDELRSH